MKPGRFLFSRPRLPKPPGDSPRSTRGRFMGKSVLEGLDGKGPYMTRYFLGPLRFHLMHRGDAGRGPHDHPWWFITFPLNSYVEEVAVERYGLADPPAPDVPVLETRLNIVRRFRFHFRPAYYTHRILGPVVPLPDPRSRAIKDWMRVWSQVLYTPGMSLDEVSAMLDRRGVPAEERTIKTLVIRGRVKHGWGFFRLRPHPETPEWIHHDDYFKMPEYDQ